MSFLRTAEDLRPCKAGRLSPSVLGGNLGGLRLGTAADDLRALADGLLGGSEVFLD